MAAPLPLPVRPPLDPPQSENPSLEQINRFVRQMLHNEHGLIHGHRIAGLLAAVGEHGLVTALPTAAAKVGDRCVYQADATNGVFWELIYDGQGSYPWKAINGPPLFAEVSDDETTTGGAYADIATVGPDIAVPLAGDYGVEIGASIFNSASSQNYASYAIGGTAAADADAIRGDASAADRVVSVSRRRRKTGLTAVTLRMKYKTTTGTAHFLNRWIALHPIRVG